MRHLVEKVARLCDTLVQKGRAADANHLRELLAHYVPESKKHVPEFWRRNYDYGPEGDSFYYGNMAEKDNVKDWLKKHKRKGPEWPKKKKKTKKQ